MAKSSGLKYLDDHKFLGSSRRTFTARELYASPEPPPNVFKTIGTSNKPAKDQAKQLLQLNHANIVKLINSIEEERLLYIEMENCSSGGDLSKKIEDMKEKKGNFSEDNIIEWFTIITGAVKYMHAANVTHLNLKPTKIFFAGKNNATLKIGGFGVAKLRELTTTKNTTNEIVGLPTHLPPEAFNGIYGFKTDIWAMGVILFELAYLELPFPGETFPEMKENIINNKRKSLKCNYSKLMENLINKLLEPDPEKRPTSSNIGVYTPQQRKNFFENQLLIASEKGDLPALKSALDQGIEVSYNDKKGRTALIFATTNHHLELVKHLLNAGADVNCKTTSGLTAMSIATRNGQVDVVKLLLSSKKLHVDDEDGNGMTPLLYASSTGNLDLVKFLIEKGADVNTEDKNHGWTALFFAARNGHDEVTKFLHTRPGIKVDHTDFQGRTVQLHRLKSAGYIKRIFTALSVVE